MIPPQNSDPRTPFTGGCYCGAVRYRCDAAVEQIQMFRCHCRDCQRVTGGAGTPVVLVPKETFHLTQGKVQHHVTKSEAMGEHTRGFCPSCGSRLTGGEVPGATWIGMTASSLDDPSWFNPKFEIWVSDAQPWDRMDTEAPKFEKYAPF